MFIYFLNLFSDQAYLAQEVNSGLAVETCTTMLDNLIKYKNTNKKYILSVNQQSSQTDRTFYHLKFIATKKVTLQNVYIFLKIIF